jgi:CHASE3 domain sensor protein
MKLGDKKVIIVFIVGVLVLFATVAIWRRSVADWIRSDHLESDTYEVVRSIERIDAHLANAESGRYGYIVTGDEQRLESYRNAVTALTKDQRALRQLISDDPIQQARWTQFDALLVKRLEGFRKSIEQQRQISGTNSVGVVLSVQGQELQHQLISLLGEISDQEKRKLHAKIAAKEAQMLVTVGETAMILLSGVVLFLWVFWLLRREIKARRAAEVEIRQQHTALEEAMRELKETHWHLEKVAEFLPLCMECGRVKTSEAQWETMVEYFRKNKLFVSHGYCPSCATKMRSNFKLEYGSDGKIAT